MGRIFETRKSTMFARWDKMAKAFTRAGKEIAIAVRDGGPSLDANPGLRRAVQNARAVNMPKDKIEKAIKKASGQGAEQYDIVLYEGYAPHGVAVVVETATNNVVRTVAKVRLIFKDNNGSIGTEGSVLFQFRRLGVFRLSADEVGDRDLGDLELTLIDHGLEEIGAMENEKGEKQIVIRGAFHDFGKLQNAIEAEGLTVQSAQSEYVPENLVELPEDKANEVLQLVDEMEQYDDVQNVYHNLA